MGIWNSDDYFTEAQIPSYFSLSEVIEETWIFYIITFTLFVSFASQTQFMAQSKKQLRIFIGEGFFINHPVYIIYPEKLSQKGEIDIGHGHTAW